MKDRIASRALLFGILVLFAMLTVPSVSAHDADAIYFSPEDIRVSGCGVTETVAIWINTSVALGGGVAEFSYDPSCANVTDYDPNTDWDLVNDAAFTTGNLKIGFSKNGGLGPGLVKIGDITINCIDCASSCCGTKLVWNQTSSYIQDSGGAGVSANWVNGTFVCGEPLVVEKTVWDGSDWVNAIGLTSDQMGEDVRFNITVTAGCLDLSNVEVSDTMDAGLLFNDTPSPPWTVGALAAGTSMSIEFNATIDGYGPQINTATATATVDDLAGLGVQASDTATVDTCPPAGFDVNKTVWDGSAWVELVSGANIGDTYRFRVEVENTGSPTMDICTMTVTDVLPGNLEYADSAKLQDHHGVWWDLPDPPGINNPTNNTYGWIIDNTVPGECLQPGQKIVVEYNATVTNYGPGTNNVTAYGYCAVAGQWVQESDNASIDVPKPDLNVTAGNSIKVNPDVPYLADYAFGPVDHLGKHTQPNSISAEVQECNGVDVVVPFDVTIVVTNSTTSAVVATCTTTLPGLAGGTEVTVWCNDSWYPTAGWDYTINVTADPTDVIPETDENNNTLLRDVTTHIHGLKGGSWQSADSNITTQQYHNGTINLLYSTGDSVGAGSTALQTAQGIYVINWVPGNFSIPVAGSTIKDARLYVYYNWDKTPDRNVSDYFTLEFNGYVLPQAAVYTDNKAPDLPWCGYGCTEPIRKYAYGYGMAAYNVTHKFKVNDINTANLTSDYYVWNGKKTAMTGMLLVVVYENQDEPERIIMINEGFDMLKAGEYYYDHKYVGVNTEEATSHTPFTAGYPILIGGKADLVTVVNHPGGPNQMQALYFNGEQLDQDYDVWTKMNSALEIGINTVDVTSLLQPTDNIASIQSVDDPAPPGNSSAMGGDWFEATNAFLIVQEAKPFILAEPESDECYAVGEQFDVLVNITPLGVPLMGAQFDLHFNASALKAETVTYGPFLEGEGSVFVSHSDIDNANGVVSFAAARQGTPVGVTGPGTFAIVHFTAETQGMTSELNLTDALASDNATPVNTYELVTYNGEVEVCSNAPPVAEAKSNFTYNNIAEKGLSKAYFIGTDSSDPDGTLTNHRWWVDDGSSLVGETAEHLFVVPMYWQGGSDGSYALANVTLTVTDDGMPLMDADYTMEVNVWIGGDATGDGRVNIADGVTFGMQFGKQANTGPDGLRWFDNPEGDKADLNNDGRVNIGDAMLLGTCWGHTAW